MIVVVEDNPADVRLLQEAFKRAGVRAHLEPISSGESALELLERGEIQPELALVDVNLPRLNGLEVLARLKANPALSAIPVLMLTSSDAPEDIATAYRHGANCYLVKPRAFTDLVELVRSFGAFWLDRAVLPTRPRSG
jgi:CheY-like chemotaxis protein